MGIILSACGLSFVAFSPLQLMIVNPGNVRPVMRNITSALHEDTERYFEDPNVVSRVPTMILTLACTYTVLMAVGLLLFDEKLTEDEAAKQIKVKPHQDDKKLTSKPELLVAEFTVLWNEVFSKKDFWVLFIFRIGVNMITVSKTTYYKAFGLTSGFDDEVISILYIVFIAYSLFPISLLQL